MKKILVIEDNPDIRDNISEFLALEGYEVFSSASGKSGLEIAFAEKPDLILCDIIMPNLDGYAVLYLLSKNKDTMNIPFMFLTARNEKSNIQKGLGLGATNYLVKPFTEDELLDAMKLGLQKISQTGTTHSCPEIELINFINDARNQYHIPLSKDGIRSKTYGKDELIFKRGDQPAAAYYLIKGEIKSYLLNDKDSQFTTNRHRNGEFFGYLAIMEGTEHEDNALTEEESSLIEISSYDFLKLMHYDDALGKRFIKLLSGQNLPKEERLISLSYYSIRRRIIEKLLLLAKEIDLRERELELMDILEEKSDMNPELNYGHTASVLNDLKNDHLINIKEGKISIREEMKLQRILNPAY